MTQIATVPASRPIGLVGVDVTAVVHNTSERVLYVTSNDPPIEIRPGANAVVTGPASAIGVGGDVSVAVDENAVPPKTPIAEAAPEAALAAALEAASRPTVAPNDPGQNEPKKKTLTAAQKKRKAARARELRQERASTSKKKSGQKPAKKRSK